MRCWKFTCKGKTALLIGVGSGFIFPLVLVQYPANFQNVKLCVKEVPYGFD